MGFKKRAEGFSLFKYNLHMSYIIPQGTQTILKIYVQPGASRNEVVGPFGEPLLLKIKIKAPPVDGAANEAVVAFIAEILTIRKSQVEFIRGETSRKKDLLIDLKNEVLIDRLKPFLSI